MPPEDVVPAAEAALTRTVAAVDLGSNSFHMVVARIQDGHIQITDRLKEMVRLGEGLTEERTITPKVAERALACLERFGQRLRGFAPEDVRVVGTNTLRQLDPGDAFIQRAESALGHAIDIIAGREEARLIYLGVAYGLASSGERRLVIDIGGGSTEMIVGRAFSPHLRESLYMGCVSMSRRYFAEGRITVKAMQRAELAGALEIRPVRELFRRARWERAVGSSGTIRAIAAVVQAQGWCEDGISAESLARLREALIEAGRVSALELKGLSDERRPVFAGGVAVLRAVFDSLGITHMQVSDYALREGLLYEMMGRHQQGDVRERTIDALCRQFHVDQDHGRRVETTALNLYRQLAIPWALDDLNYPRLLAWAARVHEIGVMVAHSHYHKHGAYLVRHADLPGFSRQEQALLAALVGGHRRRFPVQEFNALPQAMQSVARRLCIILRLAVLIHRGRSLDSKPNPRLKVDGEQLILSFPDNWLAAHPLTQLELEQEAERLAAAGVVLRFS
ncbi:MAG: exopolyphosphatase [Thermochromatium sp.]